MPLSLDLAPERDQGDQATTCCTGSSPNFQISPEQGLHIWVWINTYENTIFSGMNIHKSDVNYRGTIGFDTLPYNHKV